MTSKPSLVRFLLERIDADIELMFRNLPLPVDVRADPEFVDRFLDRRQVWNNLLRKRGLVLTCVDHMREVQGEPPVPDPPARHPVTDLGSSILKIMAAEYDEHPDYQPVWKTLT